MRRVFNFSAGPGVVPEECLAQARDEMLDWGGLGYSVIEASHRSEHFVALMHETVGLVRERDVEISLHGESENSRRIKISS